MFRKLVWFAVIYTFVVVVVGAYVRLSDAGLGCPDWPGCYGELTPHHAQDDIARAVAEQGGTHGPVSLGKAWKEMFHRYLAGGLGLVILAIAVMAWRAPPRIAAVAVAGHGLLVLVMLQAALGMWTVTLLLKPVIVTLHLLGGMATLALLTLAGAAPAGVGCRRAGASHRACGRGRVLALLVVIAQIALGGWVIDQLRGTGLHRFPDLPRRVAAADGFPPWFPAGARTGHDRGRRRSCSMTR